MSVDANIAYSLAKELGLKIDICKMALEKAKQDVDIAKILLAKWFKIDNSKTTRINKARGAVGAIFDPKANAACIIKVTCDNENLYDDKLFSDLIKEIRAEVVANNSIASLTTHINNLKKQFDSNIEINYKRFIKENNFSSLITTYRHTNNIASMIDISVSDPKFINHPLFKSLCFDLAMHIAAFAPISIYPEDIPTEMTDTLRIEIEHQLSKDGKEIIHWPNAVNGKINKWKEQRSLMTQIFLKSESLSVSEIIERTSNAISTKITINKFARLSVE